MALNKRKFATSLFDNSRGFYVNFQLYTMKPEVLVKTIKNYINFSLTKCRLNISHGFVCKFAYFSLLTDIFVCLLMKILKGEFMYILFYVCYTDTKCTKELQNKRDSSKESDKNMYVHCTVHMYKMPSFLYPLIMRVILICKI